MPSDLSLDAQLSLNDVRLRVLNRQPVSADEYRKLMTVLRSERESAARSATSAKRRASKIVGGSSKPAPLSVDQMFPSMSKE